MKINYNRLDRENKTVQTMISMYCRQHHDSKTALCDECYDLALYASQRIGKCPYGYDKPTCTNCVIHCYKPEMREKIRQVMRFAGPRMIINHPFLAIMHMIDAVVNPIPHRYRVY